MSSEAFVSSVMPGVGTRPGPSQESISTGTSNILVLETKHGSSFRKITDDERTKVADTAAESTFKPAVLASASPKGGNTILWFRRDLRIGDNRAVKLAVEKSDTVLPLYCFDEDQYRPEEREQNRTSVASVEFLVRSISALREELRKLGSDLVVARGAPDKVIHDLVREQRISNVVYQRGFSRAEVLEEANLQEALSDTKPEVDLYPSISNTLYDTEQMPFELNRCPQVFSDFRDLLEERGKLCEHLAPAKSIPRVPAQLEDTGSIPTAEELCGTKPPAYAELAEASEHGALQRAEMLLDDLKRDLVSQQVTGPMFLSRAEEVIVPALKPWLRLGCISPATLFARLDKVHPQAQSSVVYMDLLYNEFSNVSNLQRLEEELPARVQASQQGVLT